MKKTLLLTLALALVCACLFVSCSGDVTEKQSGLSYVTFDQRSRSFETEYKGTQYKDLYWFYKAVKTDGAGNTGEQESYVPVIAVNSSKTATTDIFTKGLSGTIGPFSQGSWKFYLMAYKTIVTDKPGDGTTYETYTVKTGSGDDQGKSYYFTDPVYKSTDEGTGVDLEGDTTEPIDIAVDVYTTDDKVTGDDKNKGELKFGDQTEEGEEGKTKTYVTFKWASSDTETSTRTYVPYVVITMTDKADSTNVYTFNNATTDDSRAAVLSLTYNAKTTDVAGYYTISIAPKTGSGKVLLNEGYYDVSIKVYYDQASVSKDNSEKYLLGDACEFSLRIYPNAETIISGEITENPTAKVNFDSLNDAETSTTL